MLPLLRALAAVIVAALGLTAAAASDTTGPVRQLIATRRHPGLAWSDLTDIGAKLDALYAPLGHEPVWCQAGQASAAARAAVAELLAVAQRGLRTADYDGELLARGLDSGACAHAQRAAPFEVALSASLLRVMAHLVSGRVDPRSVGFNLETAREPVDLAASLLRIARGGDLKAELDALDPPFPLYRRLHDALARYRSIRAAGEPVPVREAATLHPGESGEVAAELRTRLRTFGDLAADAATPADPNVYDDALREAVVHFQKRHGLDGDGVVGRGTIGALNVPLRFRIGQIELAMERLRWLPRTLPERFLIVNLPEFRLSAFAAGSTGAVMSSNVVVGSAARKHATPILSAEMTYVVLRPYWNVPPGILREEIQPKLESDPEYLERNDMELRDGKVRQRPGPDNSLGLIKFIFPNPHHVYLHDTPSKELFRRSRRDFSHGCIRVAKPVELAEFVLAGSGEWSKEAIGEAMQNGKDNRLVRLKAPLPVYLLYSTAIVARDGDVRFFDDIYRHDAELRTALAKGPPYR